MEKGKRKVRRGSGRDTELLFIIFHDPVGLSDVANRTRLPPSIRGRPPVPCVRVAGHVPPRAVIAGHRRGRLGIGRFP